MPSPCSSRIVGGGFFLLCFGLTTAPFFMRGTQVEIFLTYIPPLTDFGEYLGKILRVEMRNGVSMPRYDVVAPLR